MPRVVSLASEAYNRDEKENAEFRERASSKTFPLSRSAEEADEQRGRPKPKLDSRASGKSSSSSHRGTNENMKKPSRSQVTALSSDSTGGRSKKSSGSSGPSYDNEIEDEIASLPAARYPSRSDQEREPHGSARDAMQKVRSSDEILRDRLPSLNMGESSVSGSRKEKMLEEKLRLATAEKDAVQSEFDDLRELRHTEPEKVMNEWKKAADHRHCQTVEYIRALKDKLELTEKRMQSLEAGGSPSRSSSPNQAKLGEEMDKLKRSFEKERIEAKRREGRSQDELTRLRSELEVEQATTRMLRSASSAGGAAEGVKSRNDATSSRAEIARLGSSMPLSSSHERAIRRLYEDLTGIVINKVEPIESNDSSELLRFCIIFACSGYHDLELFLEESKSQLSTYDSGSSSSSTKERNDLVYVPSLDKNRDAELLRSKEFVPHFREKIRFDRADAVRFMGSLQKALKQNPKR